MKLPLLMVFALVLTPSAPADSVTVAQTERYLSFTNTTPARVVDGFDYTPFDPSLGNLTSVELAMSWVTPATYRELNPFQTPYLAERRLSLFTEFHWNSPDARFTPFQVSSQAVVEPSVILGEQQSFLMQQTFEGSLSTLIVSGLSVFSQPGGSLQFRQEGGGFGFISDSSINPTITIRATYNYTPSVPDEGSVAVLLGLSLVVAAVGYWLRGARVMRGRQ